MGENTWERFFVCFLLHIQNECLQYLRLPTPSTRPCEDLVIRDLVILDLVMQDAWVQSSEPHAFMLHPLRDGTNY